MSDNVVKLELVEVGENFRFEADHILEKAKGNKFSIVTVIGEMPDGSIWISSSANAGETLILIEKAKYQKILQLNSEPRTS